MTRPHETVVLAFALSVGLSFGGWARRAPTNFRVPSCLRPVTPLTSEMKEHYLESARSVQTDISRQVSFLCACPAFSPLEFMVVLLLLFVGCGCVPSGINSNCLWLWADRGSAISFHLVVLPLPRESHFCVLSCRRCRCVSRKRKKLCFPLTDLCAIRPLQFSRVQELLLMPTIA